MSDYITITYWIIALIASGFYGWKAVEIHSPPKKKDEIVTETMIYPWSWWLHQVWLNFLGAFVGWLTLWYLVRNFWCCIFTTCSTTPSGWHLLPAIIAFIGVTGFLPSAIVGLVSAFSNFISQLTELLIKWIIK